MHLLTRSLEDRCRDLGDPARSSKPARPWERLPGVRQLDGIEGAYFFVDRQSGKAIFISLWESEEVMNKSDEVMRPLRAELAEAFAANRVDVEHYEVGRYSGKRYASAS